MSSKQQLQLPAIWLLAALCLGGGCKTAVTHVANSVNSVDFSLKYVPGHSAIERQGYPPACTTPMFYGYHGTCWRTWPEEWVPCPEMLEETILEGPVEEQGAAMPEAVEEAPVNPPQPGQPPMPNGQTPGSAPMPDGQAPMGQAPGADSRLPAPNSPASPPNTPAPKQPESSGTTPETPKAPATPANPRRSSDEEGAAFAPRLFPNGNRRPTPRQPLFLAPLTPAVTEQVPSEPIPTRRTPPSAPLRESRQPASVPPAPEISPSRSFDPGLRPEAPSPLTQVSRATLEADSQPKGVSLPTTSVQKRTKADDDAMARAIALELQRLKRTGQLRHFSLDLNVRQGMATFSGHVSSIQQRNLILSIAQNVKGVHSVHNLIQLVPVARSESSQRIAQKQPSQTATPKTQVAKPQTAKQPAANSKPAPVDQRHRLVEEQPVVHTNVPARLRHPKFQLASQRGGRRLLKAPLPETLEDELLSAVNLERPAALRPVPSRRQKKPIARAAPLPAPIAPSVLRPSAVAPTAMSKVDRLPELLEVESVALPAVSAKRPAQSVDTPPTTTPTRVRMRDSEKSDDSTKSPSRIRFNDSSRDPKSGPIGASTPDELAVPQVDFEPIRK